MTAEHAVAPTAEAVASWLDGAVNHERAGSFAEIKLDRIAAFVRLLPTPPAPCTVAGTKGKGSTVRLIEAALCAHRVPTVAFTSPHVTSVLERWRVDGAVVTPVLAAAACTRIAAIERDAGVALTYFERTFAVACLLAAERPGSAFLCEVGLGGRLDCANALDCAVAVVTHLSHDHRDLLGPTLAHIAREKLAVARPGRPLLIAPQSPEARAAIERNQPPGIEPTWIARSDRPFSLAFPGAHQQDNAATALAAARLLYPRLDDERARRGMSGAALAARCQLVRAGDRRVLVDGAHNGPSVAATVAVARTILRAPWTLILGLAKDKEVDEVLAAIAPGIVVARCGYRSPRARGPEDWPERATAWAWFTDVRQALAAVGPGHDACVTGSFYLAGEALTELGAAAALPG